MFFRQFFFKKKKNEKKSQIWFRCLVVESSFPTLCFIYIVGIYRFSMNKIIMETLKQVRRLVRL